MIDFLLFLFRLLINNLFIKFNKKKKKKKNKIIKNKKKIDISNK